MNIKREDLVDLLVESRPNLPDQKALKFRAMYPIWAAGITITQEDIAGGKNRYQHGDRLYKCIQPHTTQTGWEPDIETASLWVVIDVVHAGTIDDPIPAAAGMEYTKGLYYSKGNAIYLMNREGMTDGETIILNYLPSELIGQYFVEV